MQEHTHTHTRSRAVSATRGTLGLCCIMEIPNSETTVDVEFRNSKQGKRAATSTRWDALALTHHRLLRGLLLRRLLAGDAEHAPLGTRVAVVPGGLVESTAGVPRSHRDGFVKRKCEAFVFGRWNAL